MFGLGLLLSRLFAPVLAGLAAIRWGQIAATVLPYLAFVGLGSPLAQYGLAHFAHASNMLDPSLGGITPQTTIDLPFNLVCFANTIWPLADTITAINVLGAAWVSRAGIVAYQKLANNARPGKGVAF